MKIQDWCCQGLSASWRSQRRTVDAETVSVTPRGRPLRLRSARAGRPPSANRPRQVRTVSTCTPTSAAIRALDLPRLAMSTICDRPLAWYGVL